MARAGGQYRAGKDGKKPTLVREATQDYPKGNKARPSEEEQRKMAEKAAAEKQADKEVKDVRTKV